MSNPPPGPVFILRRHTSDITALHFICGETHPSLISQNAPALLSGSKTGEIFFWDLKIKRVKYEVFGHNGKMITWLHAFQDNILSQGRDGFISIWTLVNDELSAIRKIPSSEIGFCSATLVKSLPVHILVPDDSSGVKVLDYESGSLVHELKDEAHGMCMCLKAVELDGERLLFVGYEDGSVVLWNCNENKVIASLQCHKEPVFSIDVDTKNYRRGISGSAEDSLCTWILNADLELVKHKEIKLTNPGVNTVKIRPDCKVLVTGGWDSKIRVFSWKTLKPLAVLSFHEQSIQCLEFFETEDKDKSMFVAGSKDSNITLWKIY